MVNFASYLNRFFGFTVDKFLNKAQEALDKKMYEEARLNYLRALQLAFDPKEKKMIENKIEEINKLLGTRYYEWAKHLYSIGNYDKAWDYVQLAVDLGVEDEYLDEFASFYKEVKEKVNFSKRLEFVKPFLERAKKFKEDGNYMEALVELKEAMNIVGKIDEVTMDIVEEIKELEEILTQEKMKQIQVAIDSKAWVEALMYVQEALSIVDYNLKLKSELEKKLLELRRKVKDLPPKDPDFEKLELEDLFKEYMRAIELFFKYSWKESVDLDSNPYYSALNKAKAKLAIAVGRKADIFLKEGKERKAKELYKWALSCIEGMNLPEEYYFKKMVEMLDARK